MSRLELMSIGRRSKRRWKARYKWERGRPTARHGTIGSEDDQLIGTPADVVLSFLCVCNKTKARRHADYFLTSAAKRMLLTI